MDFVTSHFEMLNFWPVERVKFFSNQKIGEEESNSDDKYIEESLQLVRGSSFRNELLQNPYFSSHTTYISQPKSSKVLIWIKVAEGLGKYI